MSINIFRKIFYLMLGCVLFFSCSREKNTLEPKRTVIAGVVNNFSDNAHILVVNYCNPLGDENRFAQDLIETKGYFQTEHGYFCPKSNDSFCKQIYKFICSSL